MAWIRPAPAEISLREVRAALMPRQLPYWKMLCFNRAVGFHNRGPGRKFWTARACKNGAGQNFQHRLGRTDDETAADGQNFFSYEQAVLLAQKWFGTLKTESVLDARPFGVATEMIYSPVGEVFTVAHSMKDLLEWKRISCTQYTCRTLLSLINSHILPNIGTLAVDELNGLPLRKFIKEVMETPSLQSLRTMGQRDAIEKMDEETLRKRKDRANTILGALRSALVMSWENGKTDNERAWRSLKFIRNAAKPRFLHLNRAECRALIKECPADLGQLVQGALYTGCRSRELLRMRVEDVGRDGYGVYIVPGKSFKPRFVFLPDEGMAFFISLTKGKKPTDLLFRRSDDTEWRDRQRHILKRALKAAHLPIEFTFHGLRHTYASQLVQAGTRAYNPSPCAANAWRKSDFAVPSIRRCSSCSSNALCNSAQ